jgi:hypothetical protein
MTASAFDYANVGQRLESTRTARNFNSDSGDSPEPMDLEGLTNDQKVQLLQAQQRAYAQRNRYAIGYDEQSTVEPDVRVSAQADLQQEGAIQAAGQVMGEVQVNFKSDVFPLEKLVDTDQLLMLTQAQGAGRGAPPPPAPGAAPAAKNATPTTPAAAAPAAPAAPTPSAAPAT